MEKSQGNPGYNRANPSRIVSHFWLLHNSRTTAPDRTYPSIQNFRGVHIGLWLPKMANGNLAYLFSALL
jgi:hypothetical protein